MIDGEGQRGRETKFNADKLELKCDERKFFRAHLDTRKYQARQQESVSHTCHETPGQCQGPIELSQLSELPGEVHVPKPVGNNHCTPL